MSSNPSFPEDSRRLEVIATAFNRSMKGLGIEPARYRSLPIRQRKLALYEAIHKTASQIGVGLNWCVDISDLQSKKLWDFTPDQINQHQTMLDALIAFVCLGEGSFVRRLITYLSFPEPRWSILIDSVLRAVLKGFPRGPLFRIPNESERSGWRRWALENPEPPRLLDYSSVLLSTIGLEDVKWYVVHQNELRDTSFLVSTNEFLGAAWKYYDQKQSKFCYERVFSHLKKKDYARCAKLIDVFIEDNPNQGNYDTLIACLGDSISELGIPRTNLKHDWLDLVQQESLHPMTSVILFRTLDNQRRDRRLANEFTKALLGSHVELNVLKTLNDILVQNETTQSIGRLAKTLSTVGSYSPNIRHMLVNLTPVVSFTLTLWIDRLFSKELDSLCIIGAERLDRRHLFLESMIKIVKNNDQTLLNLLAFENSPSAAYQEFADRIKKLFELRKPFEEALLEGSIDTSFLVVTYLNTVKDCFSKLPDPKWEKLHQLNNKKD